MIRHRRYELEMGFSRGLYTGWFRGINNQELAHARFGTKRGVFLGEVTRVGRDHVALKLEGPLKPGDGVVFDAGKPDEREEGGRVYQVEPGGAPCGETTLRFGHGDIDWRRVQAGQLVWKTNDPALDREVRATFEGDQIRFQRPVTLEVHGRAGTPLTLIANDGQGHVAQADSTVPLAPAQKQPLTTERLREQLGRLGGTPFQLGELQSFLEGDVILPVSELNRLRRETAATLEKLRAQPKRWQMTEEPDFPGAPETQARPRCRHGLRPRTHRRHPPPRTARRRLGRRRPHDLLRVRKSEILPRRRRPLPRTAGGRSARLRIQNPKILHLGRARRAFSSPARNGF